MAGYAHEQGKGCVIAVNKWDVVEKDGKTMQEFTKKLQNDFSFMSYAPFFIHFRQDRPAGGKVV